MEAVGVRRLLPLWLRHRAGRLPHSAAGRFLSSGLRGLPLRAQLRLSQHPPLRLRCERPPGERLLAVLPPALRPRPWQSLPAARPRRVRLPVAQPLAEQPLVARPLVARPLAEQPPAEQPALQLEKRPGPRLVLRPAPQPPVSQPPVEQLPVEQLPVEPLPVEPLPVLQPLAWPQLLVRPSDVQLPAAPPAAALPAWRHPASPAQAPARVPYRPLPGTALMQQAPGWQRLPRPRRRASAMAAVRAARPSWAALISAGRSGFAQGRAASPHLKAETRAASARSGPPQRRHSRRHSRAHRPAAR